MTERVGILVDADNVIAASAAPGGDVLDSLLADLRAHFEPVDRFVVVLGGAATDRWRKTAESAAAHSRANVKTARANPDVLLAVEGMRLLPHLDHLEPP